MTDLLELLRSVDPNDKTACNELDCRFFCFLNEDKVFVKMDYGRTFIYSYRQGSRQSRSADWQRVPEYTHSLDALNDVQEAELEGFEVNFEPRFFCKALGDATGYYATLIKPIGTTIYEDFINIKSELLPTKELAWMDAIYQTIEWKRSNEDEQ